jgi:hypothetical protein
MIGKSMMITCVGTEVTRGLGLALGDDIVDCSCKNAGLKVVGKILSNFTFLGKYFPTGCIMLNIIICIDK